MRDIVDTRGHGDHVGQFRRLVLGELVLAIPVVAFSPMFAMLLGYSVPDWSNLDRRRARHGHVCLGRVTVSYRCGQ